MAHEYVDCSKILYIVWDTFHTHHKNLTMLCTQQVMQKILCSLLRDLAFLMCIPLVPYVPWESTCRTWYYHVHSIKQQYAFPNESVHYCDMLLQLVKKGDWSWEANTCWILLCVSFSARMWAFWAPTATTLSCRSFSSLHPQLKMSALEAMFWDMNMTLSIYDWMCILNWRFYHLMEI